MLEILNRLKVSTSYPAQKKAVYKQVLVEFDNYRLHKTSIEETVQLLGSSKNDEDADMIAMATAELGSLQKCTADKIYAIEESLSELAPKPLPTQSIGCTFTFKPGAGGNEASLFAGELLRMYTRLALFMNFKHEAHETGEGMSLRDATLTIKEPGCWEWLRWQAGVQRVQRIPVTESSGRLQTSTVGILILPVLQQKEAKALYEVKDVQIDTLRSSGPGGQNVNKVESCVRLTHRPTGVTVTMQESRSQTENRKLAWELLSRKLLERQIQAEQEARDLRRASQATGLSRSDRARTWNFPQDRVTDHSLSLSSTRVREILSGGEVCKSTLIDLFGIALEERERNAGIQDVLTELEGELNA